MKFLFKNRYNETIEFETVNGFNKFVIIEKTGKSLKTVKVSKKDGMEYIKIGIRENNEIYLIDFSGGPLLCLGLDMKTFNFEGTIKEIKFFEDELLLILI